VLVIHTLPILFVCFPYLVCESSKASLMWVLPDTVYQRIIKSAYLFIVKTVYILTIHYMFQPMTLQFGENYSVFTGELNGHLFS
jgi:hypothetical protein